MKTEREIFRLLKKGNIFLMNGFYKILSAFALAAVANIASAAQFITPGVPLPEVSNGGTSTAVFLKRFENRAGVKSARWTITGLGIFRAYVNGREVGADDIFKPGFTHKSRKLSFSYDVTGFLDCAKGAKNIICAEVSTGWWRDKVCNGSGRLSAFWGVLEIEYADGSKETVPTDTSWLSQYAGPVRHATIYGGEKYDARKATPWRTDFSAAAKWPAAKISKEFNGTITPIEGRAVKLRRDLTLEPVSAWVWNGADGAKKGSNGRYGKARILRRYKAGDRMVLNKGEKLVVDFGQNCSGVPEFTATAAAGVELTGRPAEMLNDMNGEKSRGNDGPALSAYFANYRNCGTRLHYTFAGKPDESYITTYSFFGGRYWQFTANGKVEFTKIEFVPTMSIAKEDETGTIETGDKSVNRLISNCIWGMRSNYLSVPTDCPQRNERWGWTGDTEVFIGAAVYAADVYGFFMKWMTDMRDSQEGPKSKFPGCFSSVAPSFGKHRQHLIGWSDAGVIVPWTLWKNYGDTSIINANWKAMNDFVSLIRKTKYITKPGEFQTADWLSFEKYESWRRGWGSKFAENPFWPGETDEDMRSWWNWLGACFRIQDLRMMRDMALATGRTVEAEAFAKEEKECVAEFRNKHLTSGGFIPEKISDMQAPALFALRLGLLENPKARQAAIDGLRSSLEKGGFAPHTGFLATPILLDVLCDEIGDSSLAYSVLLHRTCPGWLYCVDNGATTIWERWNGYTKERGFGPVAMNSFNHYAYGAVMGWMYRTMAGIRPGEKGGYKEFILCPRPDRRIGWCKASLRTKHGIVKSEWRYEGDKCVWTFTVPEGTTANVVWNGKKKQYSGGVYVLESENAKGGVR